MSDRVFIRNLLVRGILGINPEERHNRQDILVNVSFDVDLARAAASDDIADAVNYRSIAKRIIAHVEASADHLVEKLASDLAALVLTDRAVESVTVRVEKPGALRFAESVGVELTRRRPEAGDGE